MKLHLHPKHFIPLHKSHIPFSLIDLNLKGKRNLRTKDIPLCKLLVIWKSKTRYHLQNWTNEKDKPNKLWMYQGKFPYHSHVPIMRYNFSNTIWLCFCTKYMETTTNPCWFHQCIKQLHLHSRFFFFYISWSLVDCNLSTLLTISSCLFSMATRCI